MKKLLRVFCAVVLSGLFLVSCMEENIEPINELPLDVEFTDGGDDDEPGGQPGGGSSVGG